jgi:hypothetical protein
LLRTLFLSVFLTLLVFGCSPVSDEELQSLRNETEALEGELSRLKSEAVILNRALDNVYREKDRVLDKLERLANPQMAKEEDLVTLQDGTTAPASDAGIPREPQAQGSYKVKRGDTLTQIAKDYNTTVDVLARLNPFLRGRPELMVWENDNLTLPGGAQPSAEAGAPAAGTPAQGALPQSAGSGN